MTQDVGPLMVTAASIGFLHTLLGPDHYVPFIMMSWARRWSAAKTALITLVCALGHRAGSVILGLVVGLVGQWGDLFESAVKRDFQVKDSGKLLPGHGGILDRFDAFLFAGVATYWVSLALFGNAVR